MKLISIICLLIALGSPLYTQSARVELDVPYVKNGEYKQQLDLYLPANKNFTTIVFVHGGSLIEGDRKEEPLPQTYKTFQQLGIAVAAPSYRLGPQNKWPAQPQDVAAAFAWVKNNIAARGGNREKIFLFGHSSGCLLVSLISLDEQFLRPHNLSTHDIAGVIPMGCRMNDTVIVSETRPSGYEVSWVQPGQEKKLFDGNGTYLNVDQYNSANPALFARKDIPPMLILVAEGERFFPPVLRDASEFVGRVMSKNGTAELEIIKGRKHMSAINNMVTPDDIVVQMVLDFIKRNGG